MAAWAVPLNNLHDCEGAYKRGNVVQISESLVSMRVVYIRLFCVVEWRARGRREKENL